MTEVFNKFLDELAEELNAKGAKITKLSLKGKNLTIKLQDGRQIPLRNLPLPNETMMYVATRFLSPKKVAALFKTQGKKTAKTDEELYDSDDSDDKEPFTRSTRQVTETSPLVSVLSVLAILVLVVLILGVVAYLFGRNNVPVVPPVTSRAGAAFF